MKYLVLLILFSLSHSVWANQPKPKIYVDFESMYIYSRGMYEPEEKSQHKLDPIQAEVEARENGIKNIAQYFHKTCKNIDNSPFKIRSELNSSFRSQGTEIYSNGFLEVNLRASYNSIVNTGRPQKVRTHMGETIVFELPSKIDAEGLVCGMPVFEFQNDFNQTLKVNLVPAQRIDSLAMREKVITLKFDENKKALVVANEADAYTMRNVKLKFQSKENNFLPVTIYTH